MRRANSFWFPSVAVAVALVCQAWPQKLDSRDRDEARQMLETIAKEIHKQYYDSTLHGPEFDQRVHQAELEIQQAQNLSRAYAMIGWAVAGLNDSHTVFLAPGRTSMIEYGWRMQMIGDNCYITHVRPGSDAAVQGLQPGDRVLAINGLPLLRPDFYKVQLMLNGLAPQPELKLTILPWHGDKREVRVAAKVTIVPQQIDLTDSSVFFRRILSQIYGLDQTIRIECKELGEEVVICKIPEFEFEEPEIQRLIDIAKKHRGLILDLRGNPGGSVETLKYLIGGMFDHEVKIAALLGRKPGRQAMTAKPLRQVFSGKLAVLIDSDSASSSEVFARVIQLEKRGRLFGDRSSGLVMQAKVNTYKIGVDPVLFYGLMITDADLIMGDGMSLEHYGVVPDEQIMPGPGNLADGDDPVLARAAEFMGVNLKMEDAGKLFPFAWTNR